MSRSDELAKLRPTRMGELGDDPGCKNPCARTWRRGDGRTSILAVKFRVKSTFSWGKDSRYDVNGCWRHPKRSFEPILPSKRDGSPWKMGLAGWKFGSFGLAPTKAPPLLNGCPCIKSDLMQRIMLLGLQLLEYPPTRPAIVFLRSSRLLESCLAFYAADSASSFIFLRSSSCKALGLLLRSQGPNL